MLVEKKFLVNKPRFEKSDGSFVDVTSFYQIQRKKDVARVLHGCFNPVLSVRTSRSLEKETGNGLDRNQE